MKRVNKILENSTFLSCLKDIEISEKKRIFCGHNMDHLLNVARIMEILNLENSHNIDRETVYATALLHDIGRGRAYSLHTDHALESGNIATDILKHSNFNDEEIAEIVFAILHHNDNENPNVLCSLLRKADKMSRNCFLCSAYGECNWSKEKKNEGVTI